MSAPKKRLISACSVAVLAIVTLAACSGDAKVTTAATSDGSVEILDYQPVNAGQEAAHANPTGTTSDGEAKYLVQSGAPGEFPVVTIWPLRLDANECINEDPNSATIHVYDVNPFETDRPLDPRVVDYAGDTARSPVVFMEDGMVKDAAGFCVSGDLFESRLKEVSSLVRHMNAFDQADSIEEMMRLACEFDPVIGQDGLSREEVVAYEDYTQGRIAKRWLDTLTPKPGASYGYPEGACDPNRA